LNRPDLIMLLEEWYTNVNRVPIAKGSTDESPPAVPAELVSVVDKINRLPTVDDYPLWWVRCRVSSIDSLFCAGDLQLFLL
jgi:hypothetical protein